MIEGRGSGIERDVVLAAAKKSIVVVWVGSVGCGSGMMVGDDGERVRCEIRSRERRECRG